MLLPLLVGANYKEFFSRKLLQSVNRQRKLFTSVLQNNIYIYIFFFSKFGKHLKTPSGGGAIFFPSTSQIPNQLSQTHFRGNDFASCLRPDLGQSILEPIFGNLSFSYPRPEGLSKQLESLLIKCPNLTYDLPILFHNKNCYFKLKNRKMT